jgi:hypothetical protein
LSDTIWVAIIASASAIIPQLINTYITYRKEIKLKLQDTYNQNRLNAIIEFLDCTGNIYSQDGISLGEKGKFQKSLQKLLLYFPNIDSITFDEIFKSTKEWDTIKRLEAIQPLIKQLSISIKEK